MPLYDYICEQGHAMELLRPMNGSVGEACWTCGGIAWRRPFNRVAMTTLDVVEIDGGLINKARMLTRDGRIDLDHLQTRQKFSLYQEASQEFDYACAKAEADTGRPIQSPNLWAIAKEGARQITTAGEAPEPAQKG